MRIAIGYCFSSAAEAYMYTNARIRAVTDRSSIADRAKSNSTGMDIL